ncbi:MAG: transglutaminase domain-containing protein, partial [Actinomycetota bacterium]
LAYELRRGGRAILMLSVVTGLMFFLATQTTFLFPDPRIDPASQPKRPQTRPLSDVPDRVLFTVRSSVSGPWRVGGLDVYDGEYWLLPPVKESKLVKVPSSGIVDESLNPGVSAEFEVKELGGAVLPGIPNLVGVRASGPQLTFDSRTGSLRLFQGSIEPGLKYTVTAALIPSLEDLLKVTAKPPKNLDQFLEMPRAEPGRLVRKIMDEFAPGTPPWQKFDTLRNALLKNVAADGAGSPKAVTPDVVERMMQVGSKGTPFEIVAAQAMMARWVGVPSRIGYGFDGGEKPDAKEPTCSAGCEVRPKHGATYVEVFFQGYGWLPVVGTPLQSNTNVNSNPKNADPSVLPSDEISVRVFVPVATDPRNFLFEQIRAFMLVVVPILLVLMFIYYTFPAIRKAIRRGRRRTWALESGPSARVALAYAEWRDVATDFGYGRDGDTPLMFLDRVVEDDEHTELAWLVTRVLWGDLRDDVDSDAASAAEELSRSLRRRMSQAQQGTLRVIAAVSRLSIRHPYAPDLGAVERKEKQDESAAA